MVSLKGSFKGLLYGTLVEHLGAGVNGATWLCLEMGI